MRSLKALLASLLALSAIQAEAKKYDNNVYTFKVEDDKLSKALTYTGLSEFINPFGGTARRWMLRTSIDKESRAVTHQLYVLLIYSGSWKFYEAASNDDAQDLLVTTIIRDVGNCFGGCSYTEAVGVTVTNDALRAKALTGFQVKLLAKSGNSLIIDVTPAQIQSQLTTDNQFLSADRQWVPLVNPAAR